MTKTLGEQLRSNMGVNGGYGSYKRLMKLDAEREIVEKFHENVKMVISEKIASGEAIVMIPLPPIVARARRYEHKSLVNFERWCFENDLVLYRVDTKDDKTNETVENYMFSPL